MSLALFDLDNTLIGGDSDCLWGQFLVEHGHVDGEAHAARQRRYYQDYLEGSIDIDEFLAFQLEVLGRHEMETLQSWQAQFVEEKIRPILLPEAARLIERHREQGDTPVIITATNRFLTAPIAALYGVRHLIATEPEQIDGRYTGRVAGTPSFAGGKVTRLASWLAEHGESLAGSWCYSDSHNDLPLLDAVSHAVAVDPDEVLAAAARERGWPIISLR
jgi:HAD superfamily hydrolase (TIGR01490 family)